MRQNATKLNVTEEIHVSLGRIRWGVFLSALLLVLLGLGGLSAMAQGGIFVSPQSSSLYDHMTHYENELYGQTYPNDGISNRIERLERTLFGNRQGGSSDQRLQRIANQMNERAEAAQTSEKLPLLEYLEEKVFQQTFDALSLDERLQRLEIHVFGKSFDDYPLDIRMKKLTYAMPLVAKEIRLSQNDSGMVVASTARRSRPVAKPAPDRNAEEISLLDATSSESPTPSTQQIPPERIPLSRGDYFSSVFRKPDGRVVRWGELPVRVFIREGSRPEHHQATLQALALWQRSFPFEVTENPMMADVIVDWANSNRPIGPYTQPMMHLDQNRDVRTIVLVNMTPFQTLNDSQLRRALLHQLGHAAGIWGHSSDPSDIMYPMLSLEHNDTPRQLGSRTISPHGLQVPEHLRENPAPSQRDINTLLRIYNQSGQDLKTYTPF